MATWRYCQINSNISSRRLKSLTLARSDVVLAKRSHGGASGHRQPGEHRMWWHSRVAPGDRAVRVGSAMLQDTGVGSKTITAGTLAPACVLRLQHAFWCCQFRWGKA